MGEVVDNEFFFEVGGHEVSGFAEDALSFDAPPEKITSKAGLDGVAWMRQRLSAMERKVVVKLQANSPSVKFMKGLDLSGAIVPSRFEWDSVGIYMEALDSIVQETGTLEVGKDTPDIEFTITLKNFIEMKGL